MTVVVLLGTAVPAEAAPRELRACDTRADFNLLISSARNMFCRTARRDLRRHRAPIAFRFTHAGRLPLHARVGQPARRAVALRQGPQGLPLRVQRLMGRRARMRKLREEDLEELLEQDQGEPEPRRRRARPTSAPAADKALELQKTAGNRAVGAALQRWPGCRAVPLVAKWPKEPQMIVDGR